MVEPQLYMWNGVRSHILQQHDSYVDAVKARVFPQFADIEAQAEKYARKIFDDHAHGSGDPSINEADLAEGAHELSLEHYEMLSFLKREMYLGALAGLYHVWEKALRSFLEGEFLHFVGQDEIEKAAWRSSTAHLWKLLEQFGWRASGEPFYQDIEACRIVVNVYKHGKGPSLDELEKRFPQFIVKVITDDPALSPTKLDHEEVVVTEEQFLKIARAIRTFWVSFPARLFLKAS